VTVPPLDVQQRIAGILSAYDELIENSKRRITILESMARALYREWFVHFRFPGHDSAPRVSSPLGEIPQGWEHATFAHAAVFENGDRGRNYPNGDDFVADGIPFINAGHLVDGAVNLADMNYVAEETFGQLRSGKIRKGDLLFCLRGSPGRTARTSGIRQGAIASSLVIVRPSDRTNEAFLFYTLVGEIGKQMAAELNNGAAQPNVSVGSVQKYPLLLPPIDLLRDFEETIAPIWKQMDLRRAQLSNLRKQRDLLVPRLLSGQIDVGTLAS
jgi:type I restriction enzyme S subunit